MPPSEPVHVSPDLATNSYIMDTYNQLGMKVLPPRLISFQLPVIRTCSLCEVITTCSIGT
jgi:hypothetical protein